MDPAILDVLKSFLTAGGEPRAAIRLLSDSYRGRGEMLTLLSSWLALLSPTPVSPSAIVTEAYQQLVLDAFNPAVADGVFSSAASTPSWLHGLLQEEAWRAVFHQLQDIYPRSLFVAFVSKAMDSTDTAAAVGRAAADGAADGMTELDSITAVQERVADALSGFVDDAPVAERERRVQRLLQASSRSECVYLYTQHLLSCVASSSPTAASVLARRLSEELTLRAVSASPSGASPLLADFVLLRAQRWPDVGSALLPFYRALSHCGREVLQLPLLSSELPAMAPSDLLKLYTAYASETPPSVSLLQSAPLLASLLHALLSQPSALPSHQLVHVLCCASTSSSSPSSSGPSVSALTLSLSSLVALLTGKSWGLSAQSTVRQMRAALHEPLLASLCLLFVHRQLTSAAYYDSTAASSCTPLFVSLLGQLAELYPLHVPAVYRTATVAFLLPSLPLSLSSLALIALRKQLLQLLLHLLLLQHLPALRFVREQAQHMDHSLLRLFCLGVITAVAPPLSLRLVQELMALLSQDACVSAVRLVLALMGLQVAEEDDKHRVAQTAAGRAEHEDRGERERKRLRRYEGAEMDADAPPSPLHKADAAQANISQISGGMLESRPVRSRAFMSGIGDGGGAMTAEEVLDIRQLAVYLSDLHRALRRQAPAAGLYSDDGSVDSSVLLQQLDAFFSLLRTLSAAAV